MKTKKITGLICGMMLTLVSATAQEAEFTPIEELQQKTAALESDMAKLKKLKISGYIQGQYQWGQEAASLKVGAGNEKADDSFSRFGIRRGRIKFVYEEGIASGVFQLDITEKGVSFKDAYLNIKDPWTKANQLRAGIFDRPFGNEISYSSSRRESPERSTVFQTLFPDERDLGAMLILQAPKTSSWSILKLEAGLFAGNGIQRETDSRKDFIGHLSLNKTIGSSAAFGLGVSHYNGSVYQGTENVYKMKDGGFVANTNENNIGKYASRHYTGFDAQFSAYTSAGMTQIRAEYLFGQQPGLTDSSKSPNSPSRVIEDIYIRNFQGGYVILVQDLGRTPFSAVLKYDWYDPNTKISGDEVGKNGTNKTDLSQNTFGIGALWRINPSLRLQAYYEFNSNEQSSNLAGYDKNIKDDVFTLRIQYKF